MWVDWGYMGQFATANETEEKILKISSLDSPEILYDGRHLKLKLILLYYPGEIFLYSKNSSMDIFELQFDTPQFYWKSFQCIFLKSY